MDLEETQEEARKGFEELSASFDKGKPTSESCKRADVSPVKEKLAKVRKIIEEENSASASAGSAPTNPGSAETNNALLDAIGLLSQKMDKLTYSHQGGCRNHDMRVEAANKDHDC